MERAQIVKQRKLRWMERVQFVKERKKRLKISYAELARRTGYSQSRIQKVLGGNETSEPLLNAVDLALDELEAAKLPKK